MQRFLMCSPRYFDVSYVINPWMTENLNRVAKRQAERQWSALHRRVQNGAAVELIEPQPDLPDMPFTANAGLVVGDVAIVSNFRHPERQTEERHFESWFRHRGFDVHRLDRSIFFEGAGDALLDRARNCVWMGYGHRSTQESAGHIELILDLEVVALQLVDPRFYHLDTCFCPLAGGHVMYYPPAFSEESRALLEALIEREKRIAVGEEDALAFACNAVNIGDRVILNRASWDLVEALSRAGFNVEMSPLSEFLRAGGASKCLTLRLEEAV